MNSLLVQSLITFFVITSFFFSINLPFTLCADHFQYANCSQAIKCGNIPNISYPFWGVNRADYCGQPSCEVECQDNIPVINISDVKYRILEMSSSSTNRMVKVARDDYWETLCPPSYINDSIIDPWLYDDFNSRNLSLYYDCNPAAFETYTGLDYSSNSQVCSNKVTVSFTTKNLNSAIDVVSAGVCKDMVNLTVFETAFIALEKNSTKIQDAIKGGFELGLGIDTGPCDSCEASGGKCGVSHGEFMCFCQDQPVSTNCSSSSVSPSSLSPGPVAGSPSSLSPGLVADSPSSRSPGPIAGSPSSLSPGPIAGSPSSHSPGLVAGISAGVAGTILVVVSIMYKSRKRMGLYKNFTRDEFDIEEFIRNNGSLTPQRYTYSKVKKMTNAFKDKIGKGGYGTVYKGVQPDGLVVAVKVLSESKGNGEEFINEVASIGRTSHVNIVTLLGFCYERDKRALIYEYMPNGSLDNFIHKQGSDVNANCRLEWKTLSEIAVGIARGLEYLHRGCNTRILHFDIKPQNILLDKDFCPKVSDFGLAKLCKTKESIVSMMGMRGTAGYIAPEVFSRNFGGVSHKSDVYSYGMLVLEMVGARKNVDSGVSHTSEMFPHYIYKDLELENDGSILGDLSEEENKIVRKMILMSLWCIQTSPSDRPSMSKVVEMLEGPLHSLPIPPKPYLFHTARFAEESATTSQPSETG
ncbi:LEAF RUST 10 DISEASE-RESISTANCE LOCUS RECEPTOR-LIKE PROTEIN KINASE-like 2.4 isoform X2 [Rosa chinensis]|uniref:LEAF RUST 10 DISEASE-RESISTANCE LOCUS RECEPTOR-LIKE PROTEIN KINASE-like 2.4 isoform X2 n=1 Tax=Rosa chinensis TaxID=74649 RepID=UPI001AD8C7A3|nr:LEAF RUST 10 DISEASE-RESISTANCE LOCUS RECEPTOR-LIKE PROTEIN KINASE-like 2.4 isoform X2 [Rosa chinensis]